MDTDQYLLGRSRAEEAHGHNRRTIFWDFIQNVRDRIVAQGLLGAGQLTDLMDELRAHLDDPGTLVVSHLFFQVWGRKPERRSGR